MTFKRPTENINRRQLLLGATALAACPLTPAAAAYDDSLKARGARRGITFGASVTLKDFNSSPDFKDALARDCAMIEPGVEMKWGYTEKYRGKPNYRDAEIIASFAADNGISLRGHTAIWHVNVPDWTRTELFDASGRDVLLRHVQDVVGHFRGRVAEWDVVNEAIYPQDGLPGGMQKWPPFANGDPGYIVDCYHAAHEADPAATLVYNDFGFEYVTPLEDERRADVVKLLEELKKRNAPIHGFGTQCHLNVGNNFKDSVYRQFLSDVAATGLKISVTELDVADIRLPTDIAERDRKVAEHAKRVLDVAFDEPAVIKLITWGLSDRESWLNTNRPRPDGTKQRAMPLDENLQRKPLWYAIADCLDNAPKRA